MSADQSLRVCLCGIGLDIYWSQFAGLKARLDGYVAQLAERLSGGRGGGELGPGGHAATGVRGRPPVPLPGNRQLFLYVTTYALSNTVLPLVWCLRSLLHICLQPRHCHLA
jgi:L-arabinose isomerase